MFLWAVEKRVNCQVRDIGQSVNSSEDRHCPASDLKNIQALLIISFTDNTERKRKAEGEGGWRVRKGQRDCSVEGRREKMLKLKH
jgi:hypothetical protein